MIMLRLLVMVLVFGFAMSLFFVQSSYAAQPNGTYKITCNQEVDSLKSTWKKTPMTFKNVYIIYETKYFYKIKLKSGYIASVPKFACSIKG